MAKGKSNKGGWPTKNGSNNQSGKGRDNNPLKSPPKSPPKKR